MAEEETIYVEEETMSEEKTFTEEMRVAGKDLWETVQNLFNEVTVRRIVIKNADKRILLEIPLAIGVVGIGLAPVWAAIGLIAALVVDCTIYVERVEKQAQSVE
jgi:uncharacterized membrane protein